MLKMFKKSSQKKQLAAKAQELEQQANTLRQMEEENRALRHQLVENEKRSVDRLKHFLLALLDAVDSFDRVFANIRAKQEACTPQMTIWVGNFRAVQRLLEKSLADQGLIPIKNLDQGFDPNWHEIERTVHDPSQPEDTIVEEVRKGYLWRGQELLRYAKVVVITHQPPKESGTAAAVQTHPAGEAPNDLNQTSN